MRGVINHLPDVQKNKMLGISPGEPALVHLFASLGTEHELGHAATLPFYFSMTSLQTVFLSPNKNLSSSDCVFCERYVEAATAALCK